VSRFGTQNLSHDCGLARPGGPKQQHRAVTLLGARQRKQLIPHRGEIDLRRF
jgi:hypothetical protein